MSLAYSPGILNFVVQPIDNGINRLSCVQQVSWMTRESVSSFAESEWKITAYKISSSIAISFNDYYRVHKVDNQSSPGLSSPVTHPIDWHYLSPGFSWNIDFRKSSVAELEWDIHQRRFSDRKLSWNIYRRTSS